ncbi:MAG: hypothetical protein H0W87_10055 [Actinobacteria bacterium]|nr:hypothetical protein [Actinomycetota bacterium]
MRRIFFVVLFALVLASPARAGGPSLLIGANEGLLLRTSLVETKANMALAKLAGFKAVNFHAFWWPEVTSLREYDQQTLGNVSAASRLLGIPVYVAVTNTRGAYTPVTEEQRGQFAQFAASVAEEFPTFTKVIVGNEPNLNNFWAPQFDSSGGNLAARTYERVLADTYDALKAVSPKITVIGGAVSPRGHDNPAASSKSHSPTAFIRDLGQVYRASGRQKPIMDWFAFHPYGANSSELPSTRHPTSTNITLADYDKLVSALGQAFDGTKQVGAQIPIVYDEYGIQSTIPKSKIKKYTHSEQASTKPVPPDVQGERYKEALGIAFCQPTVKAMFLYHAFDEPDLGRWQSGLYYADHTPKPSLPLVRQAFQEIGRGVIARCPGMRLPVKATVTFPAPPKAASAGKRGSSIQFQLTCNLDCDYTSGVIDLSGGRSILAELGQAIGGKTRAVRFPARALPKGRYRIVVSLVAAVNPGRASRKASLPFVVR